MAPRILYLFPDTNIFIQCRALNELGWIAWKEFDEVHLLVSRPVQSEIDKHKNRGGERLARRARKVASVFGEIIIDGGGHKVVRAEGPCVKLLIVPELKPSADLSERLDYGEPDDALVGTAYAFMQQRPGGDVRILTHDTGPMASAKMVGVRVEPIPEEWILPPESTDADKRIKELENEVARLKDTEPNFRIRCLDSDRKETGKIEIDVPCYLALTEDEVSGLMRRITSGFPMASEFGPQERGKRDPHMFAGILGLAKEVFEPPTDEEIASYENEKYPNWLRECEKKLCDWHNLLERRYREPAFFFSVSNDGIRPAKDALITIEAKGRFKIMPPGKKEEDGDENQTLGLARPPRAPQGKWKNTLLEPFEALQRSLAMVSHVNELTSPIISMPSRMRDPNGFFWKPLRPKSPTSEFSLECEQWRHGIDAELFGVGLYFDKAQGSISGALECRIHAENLSRIVMLNVLVRIKVSEIGAYESASAEVEELIGRK